MSHREMIGLQAEKHELVDEDALLTTEQYALHLMHSAAYRHAARIVEGQSVLDIGCNTGYGSIILSEHADHVVGVDVSGHAIALAKKKIRSENLRFEVIDGMRLPFLDNTFDIITCFQLIEHLVEYESFMAEAKRVLRPDGIVLFTTPNARLRLDPGMKPWNEFHVREFTAEELRATLEEHFGNVGLLALYGREPVHRIVANRADRIRRSARARAAGGSIGTHRRSLRTVVKALLPTWAVTRLAAARARKDAVPSLAHLKRFHGPDDFHYQPDGMDAALEFMAVCSAADITLPVGSLSDRGT